MESFPPTTAIQRLEAMAHAVHVALTQVNKGSLRNRLVMRLAGLDQVLARCKDQAGYLGLDVCTYLED